MIAVEPTTRSPMLRFGTEIPAITEYMLEPPWLLFVILRCCLQLPVQTTCEMLSLPLRTIHLLVHEAGLTVSAAPMEIFLAIIELRIDTPLTSPIATSRCSVVSLTVRCKLQATPLWHLEAMRLDGFCWHRSVPRNSWFLTASHQSDDQHSPPDVRFQMRERHLLRPLSDHVHIVGRGQAEMIVVDDHDFVLVTKSQTTDRLRRAHRPDRSRFDHGKSVRIQAGWFHQAGL